MGSNDEASNLIDEKIMSLADWRGDCLAKVRALILSVDHGIVEEWKWRGVPVWSYEGILCTGEVYRSVVKLTFAKGAALPDPSGLFNASLDGKVRRAIDLSEATALDAAAFGGLVRAAIDHNRRKVSPPKRR